MQLFLQKEFFVFFQHLMVVDQVGLIIQHQLAYLCLANLGVSQDTCTSRKSDIHTQGRTVIRCLFIPSELDILRILWEKGYCLEFIVRNNFYVFMVVHAIGGSV